MAPSQFQDDLAQWDLCTGKGLVSDLDAWRDRYIAEIALRFLFLIFIDT
jgi:integrase/recombinase XerD